MKVLYLLFFVILLFGCSKQSKAPTDSTLPVLDLSKEYPEKRIDIHDLGEVEYISLETTDESVMTVGLLHFISDEYIIVQDLGVIQIFDRKGKHITRFDHTGPGPRKISLHRHSKNSFM